MPLTKSKRTAAQAAQISQAREKASTSTPTSDDVKNLLEETKCKLHLAEEKAIALTSSLVDEQKCSAELMQALGQEKQSSTTLCAELNAMRVQLKEMYLKFRVERRARQRVEKRKHFLEEQCRYLKMEAAEKSAGLKKITTSASETIKKLLSLEKENSALRAELLATLTRCAAEATESQQRLSSTNKKLKGSRLLASNLAMRCKRATAVKDKAVNRAREQVQQERSVHSLLSKGVYSEDTRNLVRLLVQAGCVRGRVSEVIHAVFQVAGVTVRGNISRRTVSRIVLEGYFAAVLQIAFEMDQADCE
jgi:hypothetical protein